jgi:hypothetical protein
MERMMANNADNIYAIIVGAGIILAVGTAIAHAQAFYY